MGLDMYLYEKHTHEVAYWRKANAIHNWIINRTESVDDCTPINLYLQDLIDLRETCQQVLDAHTQDVAYDLLPPASGFFFGTTDIDEWYWDNVQDTLTKLNAILEDANEDTCYEYRASW